MPLLDGDLWGDPLTTQTALRVLQVVGDHTNGLPPGAVRDVANGLLMVTSNPVAQRLGRMILTLIDTAVAAEMTEEGAPMIWSTN